MSLAQNRKEAVAGRDPVVVLAADENFAMPLAATVRSALDQLSPDRVLRIYVLDAGLTDATKERLERSWPVGRYQITWVYVDPSTLGVVPVSGHVNLVSYYRILMPQLLPAEVRRVIYLDADLIICTDLGRLWDCQLEGQLCLAAQDCAAPCLDSAIALKNYAVCGPHLGSTCPIANYRELGLDPKAAYFNAGVLLVDLAAWRAADLSGKMIACLEQNKQYVRWWDQYALNVVLAGRWGTFDARWNQGANVFAYPTWSQSPFDQEAYTRLRDDPYIVHFTTRYKPWLLSCLHPRRKQFFEVVDRTAWAGWRPWQTMRLRPFLDLAKAQERRLRINWRQMRSRMAG
jgi:lipopolysaccharide biosynthesis glycosyltransferase